MDEAYTGFAFVYDMFMDTTPYEKWFSLLRTDFLRCF